MRRSVPSVASLALGIAFVSASALAADGSKPLYEFGIFGVAEYAPDYPGSDQNHLHGIPLPYIAYRGDTFQIDGNRARGVLLDSRVFTFDISATGSFGANSKDDRARAGMPQIDYLGEIGPRLHILLAHNGTSAKIDLELAARAVLSTDLTNLNYRGLDLNPELAYRDYNFMHTGGELKLSGGAKFATRTLMNYFYQVPTQFSTPTRPVYGAQGGYLGSEIEATFHYPINDRMKVIGLLAEGIYSGAANTQSPLFKKTTGFTAGMGLSYSIWQSEARAVRESE